MLVVIMPDAELNHKRIANKTMKRFGVILFGR